MLKNLMSALQTGKRWAIVLVGVALFYNPLAWAQNQVSNPNLDTQLAPWAQFLSSAPDPVGAGSLTWVSTPDVNNNPSSGSAADTIDTSAPETNAAAGMSQCVNFAATTVSVVNYGMSFQVPSATTADGSINATVEVRLFSAANCSNFIAGGSQGRTINPGLPADSIWYSASDPAFAVMPPALAQSAQIRAYLRETDADATALNYTVYFDKVFLALNGTTPVRLKDFRVD
jgi:hypothetical protein